MIPIGFHDTVPIGAKLHRVTVRPGRSVRPERFLFSDAGIRPLLVHDLIAGDDDESILWPTERKQIVGGGSGRTALFLRDRVCKNGEPITLLVSNAAALQGVVTAALFANEEDVPLRYIDFLHDAVPETSFVDIFVTTSEPFLGRLFVVPKTTQTDFLIKQLTIDDQPMIVTSCGIPAQAFSEDAVDVSLRLVRGTHFALRVHNLASFPRPFGLRMHGSPMMTEAPVFGLRIL